MSRKRVLVGVSGGIDSAAVVMMLQGEGYEVLALWVDMLGLESQRDDVVKLCTKLGVELKISDAREEFQRLVVQRVIREHREGMTPSPCTICNPEIKWKHLWRFMDSLGCDHIATGHYISIVELLGKYYLKCGVDAAKDQSYYLWAMGVEQEILAKTITPLGEFHKREVREYVTQGGFEELCEKRESQSLCFVQGGYGEFLRGCLDIAQGDLVDDNGVVVGCHSGAGLYTIGQKRGFEYCGDAGGKVEVRRLDIPNNRVEVGLPLLTQEVVMRAGWFSPIEGVAVTAKIRGIGVNPSGGVVVESIGENDFKIHTTNNETFWAPAVGQPVVLFQGDIVVGGGVLR